MLPSNKQPVGWSQRRWVIRHLRMDVWVAPRLGLLQRRPPNAHAGVCGGLLRPSSWASTWAHRDPASTNTAPSSLFFPRSQKASMMQNDVALPPAFPRWTHPMQGTVPPPRNVFLTCFQSIHRPTLVRLSSHPGPPPSPFLFGVFFSWHLMMGCPRLSLVPLLYVPHSQVSPEFMSTWNLRR